MFERLFLISTIILLALYRLFHFFIFVPMLNDEILSLAKKLWDYHLLNNRLEKVDCILTLGSHDLRVPERAAELYLQGFAPLMIMSGGLGNFTQGLWTEKEADKFATVAIEKGIPPEVILIENNSTNTGENIVFTQKLLEEKGLDPQSFIVVQKPYMERRSYATFKKHWPNKKLLVTSPQISFEAYPNEEIPMEKVINIMAGDLQRIKLYPEKGFQVYQEIPADIWDAFEKLVAMGFDKHLMK
ncbi:MAG TPA: YdcF family protein [Hanamia sp.]|nr:YdcF family protein [Hanamia sp.]